MGEHMLRLLRSLVAATAVVGFSTVAVADGMPTRYAAPAYTSWSGFYLGGSLGFQWTDVDWNFPAPIANQITSTSQSYDHAVWGAHVGIQHQFGAIVVGLEAGAKIDPKTSLSRRESSRCAFPLPFEDRCDVNNVNKLYTLGGRLGWTPASKWLLYATGGYASVEVDTGIRFGGIGVPPLPGATPVSRGDARHDGWYIGGGVEYMVHKNVIIGLEYQHFDFGTVRHCSDGIPNPCGLAGAGTLPLFVRDVDLTMDVVSARLTFKFGRDREVAAPLK
jgi:opacity protein-like surface antigen